MCGIAGAIVYAPDPALSGLFFDAVYACRSRGEDSFGLVRWSPHSGWKECRCHGQMTPDCREFFSDRAAYPHFFLHTSRAEPTTEFQPVKTEADIPPFRDDAIAVAHNGIIANDSELARRFRLQPRSNIDTAILPELVRKIGVWRAIAALRGGAALGILDVRQRSLYLARNFLPITVIWRPGILAFASEASFFPHAGEPFPPYRTWEMPPFSAIEFSCSGYRAPLRWGEIPNHSPADCWHPFPDF